MKQILSIQSHVAFGHVGNAAAVFPLQRLGHQVIAINTVQFSNHTGYGAWTGQVFGADHIANLLDGLEARGVLENVGALLTGYLGDAAIGEIVESAFSRLPPSALWLCDPVMGDEGRGFFVREGIPAFFRDRAVPAATIVTPNQFELEYLTGRKIGTLDEARAACNALHETGPRTVLVTSLIHQATPEGVIQMLASSASGEAFLVSTPRLPLTPAPNGAGDCTAALFLSHILNGAPLPEALSKTAGGIFAVFQKTQAAKTRELALIAAQDAFTNPPAIEVVRL